LKFGILEEDEPFGMSAAVDGAIVPQVAETLEMV
jgi:hypothetical protein